MSLRLQFFWNGTTGYKLFKVTGAAGSPTYTEITLPVTSLNLTKRRPCFVEYWDNFVIMTNAFSESVVIYDNGTSVSAWVGGLDTAAPGSASAAAGGAGVMTGTITAVYLTFAHESASGFKFAESNPSASILAANLTLTNGSIAVSNIPAASPDGRVNKVYIYVEAEGTIARFAGSCNFGAGTQTINLTLAALAERTALPNDGIEIRTQARTRVPTTRYSFLYHKRLFYAMNDTYPYRLYYSEVDEPEAVDPSNYFDTESHETVIGMGEWANTLVVFGRRCKYGLTGWSSGRDGNPADMSFRKIDPGIGTVCHHSILSINGRLWFWAEDGPRIWDGQNHWIGHKMQETEAFAANPAAYYNGIARNDISERCYLFFPYDLVLGYSRPFVFYYEMSDPTFGDEPSETPWGYDRRGRFDTGVASWREDDGEIISLVGSSDGYVRVDNDPDDVDDDGDSYLKKWVIVPKHNFMSIPGGGLDTEGKRFDRVWEYMNCQDGTVTIKLWAGDEKAYTDAYGPTREDTLVDPTTTRTDDSYTYTSIAKSVWEYKPDISGRGLTVAIEVSSPPVDSVWYGYTTIWRPGASARLSGTRV